MSPKLPSNIPELFAIGVTTVMLLSSLGGVVAVPPGHGMVKPAPAGPAPQVSESPGPDLGGRWLDTGVGALPHRLTTLKLASAGSYGLGGTPSWLAYDHADRAFFVAVPPSSVDILPDNGSVGQYVAATIPVGSSPFGVAVDNSTDQVFVTNSGSANVSVLAYNRSTPVATIAVGTDPMGVAYDSVHGEIYVANNGSDNVTVLSGSTLTVVANVPVGSHPLGVAADPATGDVYVANHGSSNLTVISGSTHTVLANVDLPSGPYGVAVDNATGEVYVSDEGANEVSAISTSNFSRTTNISISTQFTGLDLQGIAYDWGDQLVWVAGGFYVMIAVSPSTHAKAGEFTEDPAGVVYDPDTGALCATNTANRTFQCVVFYPTTYTVRFSETGLPSGTTWVVTLNGVTEQGTSPADIAFQVPNGTYSFGAGVTGYYVPTPASGYVHVNGSAISVQINYSAPARYLVTFLESGLATGTPWWVWVGGATNVSTSLSVTFRMPNGSYNFTAWATAYVSNPSVGHLTVKGSAITVRVTFIPAPYVVTFLEAGLPPATVFEVTLNGIARSGVGSVPFNEPNGSFPYTVAAVPGYYATPSSGNVTVRGANVTVSIAFEPGVPPVRYAVTFAERGLPPTALWTVALGGQALSTNDSSLTFYEANGTYTFAVGPMAGYSASPMNGTVTVLGFDRTIVLSFAPEVFQVTFRETGLLTGSGWGVVLGELVEWSTTDVLTFQEGSGSYGYVILPVDGYATPRAGTVEVNSSDVVVSVEFEAQRYPVVFVEIGLPEGSTWGVDAVRSTGNFSAMQSTVTHVITLFLPNGTYNIMTILPFGYDASPRSYQIIVADQGATAPTMFVSGIGSTGGGGTGNVAFEVALATLLAAIGVMVGVVAVLLHRAQLRRDR